MAAAKKCYHHPQRTRRASSSRHSNAQILALLLLAASTAVRPFFAPSAIPHRSSSTRSREWTSAASTSRGMDPAQGRDRRRRNRILYSSKPDGDDDDDEDNPTESQMPVGGSMDSGELTLSDATLIYGDDDDDDDVDITEDDPYARVAPSEFAEEKDAAPGIGPSSLTSPAKAIVRQSRELNTSPLSWGGALSTLRARVKDVESGRSTDPSTALFRTISRERPNEAIGRFVSEANPEVVRAMTSTVTSLLGSLSNPNDGVETIVLASGERLASLCFQLQMTGYMFRNAEYVVALRSLMDIRGEGATLEEYRAKFRELDADGSGYLERDEIEALLAGVYEEDPPAFEVTTFLEFFDSNHDGRVSWEEFERGFGVVTTTGEGGGAAGGPERRAGGGLRLPGSAEEDEDEDEEEDEEEALGEPAVSGTIQVEMEDGRVIEVDAQEYINDLKQQARELKEELAKERGTGSSSLGMPGAGNGPGGGVPGPGGAGGITGYVASLQGNVKALTEGISPEVVESMKLLIEFVLEGGSEGGGGKARAADRTKEMELPGAALQQLALWQLVMGYRLRETEATGDWRRMLE